MERLPDSKDALPFSNISRTCFTPLDMAESSKYSTPNSRDNMRANVVFPVPGGPQNMSENGCFDATALVSRLFSCIKSSCPINSESTWGRILSASGGKFLVKREVEDIPQNYSRFDLQENKKEKSGIINY
jgi:hypothetical protein